MDFRAAKGIGKAVAASRQTIAPGTAAASVVAGVAAILLGLFNIGDCVRFQTAAGQCSDVAQDSGMKIGFGAVTLLGVWSGYWTTNPALRASGGGAAAKRKRNSRGQFVSGD